MILIEDLARVIAPRAWKIHDDATENPDGMRELEVMVIKDLQDSLESAENVAKFLNTRKKDNIDLNDIFV